MPIYESTGIRRSNLTKAQQREAEAAIYGLHPTQPMDISEISPAEIERMRALVAAHDRQGKVNEFDLNNPPQDLRFRPFPKMIYNHKNRNFKVVHNEEELAAHIEQGWDTLGPGDATGYRHEKHGPNPNPEAEPDQPEFDPATQAEIDAANAELRKPKKQTKG